MNFEQGIKENIFMCPIYVEGMVFTDIDIPVL
jgi:hypothetical protein